MPKAGFPRSDRPDCVRRRALSLGPSYRLFYDDPIKPVRGCGVWLYDADGNRYLDAYNNVPCVGHAHPRVAKAIADQASRLNTHTRYLDDLIVDYAERLKSTMPRDLDCLLFTCSGSEANDLAMRIARTVTGGQGVVASDHAYHGGTIALSEISASLGSPVARHVRTVAPPGALDEDSHDRGAFARRVAFAFDDLRAAGIEPAALVFDTIFSSDGVFVAASGVLHAATVAARAAGALVVADEVQAGFGRTGDGFWGLDSHAFAPDIMTMGKPMGAGYPLAGLSLRRDHAEAFAETSRYFNTFGGTPLAAVAGLAVLDILQGEDLLENARRTGSVLQSGLQDLCRAHTGISEVRGQGLFWGVSLQDNPGAKSGSERATEIVNGMRRRGVLISSAGPRNDVLKIRPPLTFDATHARQLLDALAEELNTQSAEEC